MLNTDNNYPGERNMQALDMTIAHSIFSALYWTTLCGFLAYLYWKLFR
jgi:hypothetical protein